MREMGVKIDISESDDSFNDFNEIISACKIAFRDYEENKNALMKLIDEREEMAREREDLGFDLERATAELNLLRNQFEKSDAGKLTGQVANLQEESKELKNDFIIKMSSFTQEIDTLKSKLSFYEQADVSRTDQTTTEEVKSPADGTR